MGDEDIFHNEYKTALRDEDKPSRLLPDLNGKPVRNRYLPLYQRRMDINKATVCELEKRLPLVASKRAQAIVEYIRENGAIKVRQHV